MFQQIKNSLNSKNLQQLLDVRNVVLYVFGVIVLAIAWSGAKTVQNNYELQKRIATLKQQNQLISLQNGNTYLQNQFYQTNEYLELSARQNLGLSAPGEQILLVPQNVAMKYIDQAIVVNQSDQNIKSDNRPKYVKNLEAWRDFLLGITP